MTKKLKVLLVEPDYRRNSSSIIKKAKEQTKPLKKIVDESLWYPPIGLMKLARFHNDKEDEVDFTYGCKEESEKLGLFKYCDRIYITTLFTFQWNKTIKTIDFYKNIVANDLSKIYVGGILASLLADKVYETTGIKPVEGIIRSPKQINLLGDENIDHLPPDYNILDSQLYAINDTYYAYATRGCSNSCTWCGVPKIEPGGVYSIGIKKMIESMRNSYGEKSRLKLMDNNVLASKEFPKIVDDLVELGYGKNNGEIYGLTKERTVDFNQGLDARFITEESMRLLNKLNIKPMRIAFDRVEYKEDYIRALTIANSYGVKSFSNYILYNYNDTPKDFYDRLMMNIELNEKWRGKQGEPSVTIYSYPMRYAPIDSTISPTKVSPDKDLELSESSDINTNTIYEELPWTRRFIRNIEIMKGAAHGVISPTPSLARRTLGETFIEFIHNLYMPEELLRYRNKYERRVYELEPSRKPGNGKVEDFHNYLTNLIEARNQRFIAFHNVVSKNSKESIRKFLLNCVDKELKKWLKVYLK